MALVEIPVRSELTRQLMEVVLDRQTFRLRLIWNERQAAWTLDVMRPDDSLLAAGGKITSNWNPFRNIIREDMPLGRFLAIDREGFDAMPTQLQFGLEKRVGLFYEEAL